MSCELNMQKSILKKIKKSKIFFSPKSPERYFGTLWGQSKSSGHPELSEKPSGCIIINRYIHSNSLTQCGNCSKPEVLQEISVENAAQCSSQGHGFRPSREWFSSREVGGVSDKQNIVKVSFEGLGKSLVHRWEDRKCVDLIRNLRNIFECCVLIHSYRESDPVGTENIRHQLDLDGCAVFWNFCCCSHRFS